ncbi:MAG: tetratricopeptide repeat protein [Verrucomicrobiota bacterium]
MAVDFDASAALNRRARLLLERHRPEEAEDLFRQSLAANPENEDSHFGLAQCLVQDRRRAHKALEEVDRALALNPNFAPYHAYRALILGQMLRHGEARRAIATAQELAPQEAYVWFCAGQVHRAAGKWPEAEAAARQALAIAPRDVDHLNLLSTALRMQNKDGENESLLESALRHDPENADTHANVGWAWLARDRDRAEHHFMEALRLEPHHDAARLGLLKAFQTRNRLYRAVYRLHDRVRRYSLWQITGLVVVAAGLLFLLGAGLEALGVRHMEFYYFATGLALLGLGALALAYNALGHVIVLTDPRARLALTAEETTTAWFVLLIITAITLRLLYLIVFG